MKNDWKVLSSIYGEIEYLLVTLPPSPDEYVDQYYAQIEEAFGDRSKLIRFRNFRPPKHPRWSKQQALPPSKAAEQRLLRILEGRDVISYSGDGRFFKEYVGDLIDQIQCGSRINNTEWAQDAFAVLQNAKGESAFLQPLYASRSVDKFVSLQLASWEALDMMVRPSKLLIEGGNLLAGDNYIIAGKDMLAQNMLHRFEDQWADRKAEQYRQVVETAFLKEFGVDHILWLGFERTRESWKNPGTETFQPAFHIDLFVTLGGKNAEGKEIVFLGDPEMARSLLKGRVNLEQYPHHPGALGHFKDIQLFFDRYAHSRSGTMPEFQVIPIPLFILQDVVLSFNNGLTEHRGGLRAAYLPDYESSEAYDIYEKLNPIFRILKAATEDIFRQAGFTKVQWIGPGRFYRKLAMMRGSLHCITKVLRRNYGPGGQP